MSTKQKPNPANWHPFAALVEREWQKQQQRKAQVAASWKNPHGASSDLPGAEAYDE